jgi:Acetyltransferase (GNAT) domain
LNPIYSQQDFLESFGAAYFPGVTAQLKVVHCEDSVYSLPYFDGRAITKWAFVDFYEPNLEVVGHSPSLRVPFIARVAKIVDPAVKDQAAFDAKYPRLSWPAPFICWKDFLTFEEFKLQVITRRSNHWKDLERVKRKIISESREMRFVENDPNPMALQKLIEWKSLRYQSTGAFDLFANPQHKKFFDEMSKKSIFRMSTLYFGETLVAVHAGALVAGRRYYWMPAHDPELNAHSPGKVLLNQMLEFSYDSGDVEFDFMIGGEEYKWLYANTCRVVTEAGVPPIKIRLRRFIKSILLLLGL